MFKVKDNMELSVLEKYGFKRVSDRIHLNYFQYEKIDGDIFYRVKEETRELYLSVFDIDGHGVDVYGGELKILYHLIKDDIIEVVE